MTKKILIISSDNTGHGHKSITESLCEKIRMDHDIKIHVVDGFSLGGHTLMNIGKTYGPITRVSEKLWEKVFNFSTKNPVSIDKFIEILIRDSFQRLLKDVKPDLILSVHPNFNGSVLNILEKQLIKIPFITLIADLVNISTLWADKRADYIISPTIEARDKCIEYGISPVKIKVMGFPVRSRFFQNSPIKKMNYQVGSPLNFLIMSGGEGVGSMENTAKILLNQFDCKVKIVAGRNTKLRAILEESLSSKYGNKVEIYGFTKDIQDLMFNADLIITRGSPNVMFEAFASNTPIIITGSLPGQEQDNPAFAEKYNLGVICKYTDEIEGTINRLLENEASKLNHIINCQKGFVNPQASEEIIQFLLEVENHYEWKLQLA